MSIHLNTHKIVDTYCAVSSSTKKFRLSRNLVVNAMKMGKAKDKNFLYKLIYASLISIDGYATPLTDNYKDKLFVKISRMIDAYNSKYGDDWDVVLSLNDHLAYTYTITFVHIYREQEIRNSAGRCHLMRDLVIGHTFYVNNSTVKVTYPMGTRLSLLPKELGSGYMHSHLSSRKSESVEVVNDYFDLYSFCTGTGTDVEMLLTEINSERFDAEKFELYLYTVDTLAGWESTEGGPYINMSQMSDSGANSYSPTENTGNHVLNLFTDTMTRNNRQSIPLDFYISADNTYKIKRNDKTTAAIRNFMIRRSASESNKYLVKYDRATSNWFSVIETKKRPESIITYTLSNTLAGSYFYYGGKQIKFKVIGEDNRGLIEVKIEEFTIHPQDLNYVCTQLENRLYQACVRLSRIEKSQSQGINT